LEDFFVSIPAAAVEVPQTTLFHTISNKANAIIPCNVPVILILLIISVDIGIVVVDTIFVLVLLR
jgi:hypothetical protein